MPWLKACQVARNHSARVTASEKGASLSTTTAANTSPAHAVLEKGLFALEETSGKKRGLNPLSTLGFCIPQSLC